VASRVALHHAKSGQVDAHGRRGRLLRPIALNRGSPLDAGAGSTAARRRPVDRPGFRLPLRLSERGHGVATARLFAVTCRQGGVTLNRNADVEIVDILVFGYLPSWRPCERHGSVWRVTLQSGFAGAAL
jgi:hypothetical protein